MQVNQIIQQIDAEIQRLQQARALLSGTGTTTKGRVGRPPSDPTKAPKVGRKKRRLSAEGRKRIADAMKKRWAERRKQQSSK